MSSNSRGFTLRSIIDAPRRAHAWWTSSRTWQCGTLTYTPAALALLFFWLLWGDVCYQLMEWATPNTMPLWLKSLGAPDWIMSIMMTSLSAGITFFVNPVISFRSDRYRSKWGRRIPFIACSAPLIVICLVFLAYGDRVGYWLQAHFLKSVAPNTIVLSILAVALALFTFFNTFVTSVFWYLFNDVVPEHLLAKFMSWFRVVSMVCVACCQKFVYKHVLEHHMEIFLWAGLLYFVGFSLMCVFVKEGSYPPPPENIDKQQGRLAAFKTYAEECFSLWHYRYQFIITFIGSVGAGIGMFGQFMSLSLGLSLEQIGTIAMWNSVCTGAMFFISGWLADRFHPIRIVRIAVWFQLAVLPTGLIWFFWHPPAHTVFWYQIIYNILITAPLAAMMGVWDPPLFMRYFPRDRYGQFCSANAMCRAGGFFFGGFIAGGYLKVITTLFGTTYPQYYYIPFWHIAFAIPGVFLVGKMYQSWKKYGGDSSYIPPLPKGDEPDVMSGPGWESETKA